MKQDKLINQRIKAFLWLFLTMLVPLGAWAETSDGAGIWLGETLVKEANAADVFGDGTVHYDYSSNTLTLNNASVGAIGVRLFTTYSTPLNIELVGNNAITSTEGKAAIYSKSNESGVRVNIQSTGAHKGTLSMNVDNNEQYYFIHNAITYTIADPLAVVSGSIDASEGIVVIGESYGLTVAGTEVNIVNANNITGNNITGSVSYDAATQTLTLNGATIVGTTIGGGCIITKRAELNIVVIGANSLGCSGDTCTAIRAEAPISQKLSIVNGDNACWLEFSGDRAIRNFSSVTISGLTWNGDYTYHDNMLYSYDDQEVGDARLDFATVDYYLTVGGVQVMSSTASNITGDNISDGTVSYNAGNHTLTLDNAVITAEGIVWNEDADLTINIIGTGNSITVESGAAVKSNSEGYDLHFSKGSEESTLILQSDDANSVFSGFDNAAATSFGDFYRLQSRDGFKAAITTQAYPLKVGGYQVNYLSDDFRGYEDRIFPLNSPGDATVTFTKSGTDNVLTLTGASLSVTGAEDAWKTVIESGFNNLQVRLEGSNEIICNGSGDKVFGATTDFAKVIFDIDEDTEGHLSVSVAEKSNIFSGITPVYPEGTGLVPQGEGEYVIGATIDYNLSIGDLKVTNANADAIHEADPDNIQVEGGEVTFDPVNAVLTLDNATLMTPITSSLENLTIRFKGTNKVNAERPYDYYHGISSTVNTATLTFEVDGEGTLELNASTNKSVVSGFASVSFGSGDDQCYLHSSSPVVYDGSAYTSILAEGGYPDFATISNEPAYPLWIQSNYGAGKQVTTSGTAITADGIKTGIVVFNDQTNTLSLKNANIDGMIASALGDLTLSLDGANTISCEDDYASVLSGNAGALTISKSGANASLQLQSDYYYSYPVIQGFHSLDYTGFTLEAGEDVTPAYGLYQKWESSDLYGLYDASITEPETDPSIISAFFYTGGRYPLWVAGTQVMDANLSNVLADGFSSVSYDTDTETLTLKGTEVNGGIVIGEEIENLTVHLIGYNQISGGEFAFDIPEGSTLTFTTSTTFPGSLRLNSDLPEVSEGTISYQNGLALVENTIQATKENTTIVNMTGFVSVVNEQGEEGEEYTFIYSNVSACASKAVLSSTVPVYMKVSPRYGTTAAMWFDSNDLNDIDLLTKLTFQFDWGECTNKNVKIQIRGIQQDIETGSLEADGKVYSDEVSLTNADSDGILEIPLTSMVTSDNIQLYFTSEDDFSFVPLNIGFTNVESKGISVAGVSVSELNADDVLGDGTVSYDEENNVLILNGANITSEAGGDFPGIRLMDGTALNVKLIGNNTMSDALFYGLDDGETGSTLTLMVDADQPGTLTMTQTIGAPEYSQPDFFQYFTDVVFDNAAMTFDYANHPELQDYYIGTLTVSIAKPSIGAYDGGEGRIVQINPVNEGSTIKYSIDYADDTEDVEDADYTESFVINKPATITAYEMNGDKKSGTATAYNLSVSPMTVSLVYGAEAPAFPALTVLPANEDFSIYSYYSPGSFASVSEGQMSINGVGRGMATAIFNYPEANGRDYVVLNDTAMFVVEVLPAAPVVNVEEGIYDDAQTVTITSPYAGGTVMYKLSGDEEATLYEEPVIISESTTLTAWVNVTKSGNYVESYDSEEITVQYVIRQDPELAYSSETATWVLEAEEQSLPTLSYPEGVEISYESSNEDVATVDEDGNVTVVGIGVTTITATSSANDVYLAATASYTLTAECSLDIDFGTRTWATYCAAESLETPEGIQAYIVDNLSFGTNSVNATEVGFIPANVPVLLERQGDQTSGFTATAFAGIDEVPEGNMLGGSATASTTVNTQEGLWYVLYNDKFVRTTSGTIPAGRAYLLLALAQNPEAPALTINVGGETTGINDVRSQMDDGRSAVYNLSGQRVAQPAKGLYIVNGRKVVKK